MSSAMNSAMSQYLTPTATIDCCHQSVVDFSHQHAAGDSQREQAVSLYYAVRDLIRYDPYALDLNEEGFKASALLVAGSGWCVPKAILLAACCRAMGIAARLGFADVKNHLSTERLRATMKTDVFHWHGYTSIYLDGHWVKATPAFNLGLCEKFGLKPLEFDGRSDSIYHEFDQAGNKHMEYIIERGEYADLPLAQMLATFAQSYPDLNDQSLGAHSFDQDVNSETGH